MIATEIRDIKKIKNITFAVRKNWEAPSPNFRALHTGYLKAARNRSYQRQNILMSPTYEDNGSSSDSECQAY